MRSENGNFTRETRQRGAGLRRWGGGMGGALAPRQRSRRRSPGLLPPAGRPGGPHGQAGAPGWRPAPSTPVTKQAARVPRAPTRFLLEEVAKEQRELMGRGVLTDSLPGPSPPWVAGHQTRVLGPEGAPEACCGTPPLTHTVLRGHDQPSPTRSAWAHSGLMAV